MKYDHWTKIDDGAEGAWAADIWFKTLQIIKKHEGEYVYDESSSIYDELEKNIPSLAWRSHDGTSFRPYFRDFSKPWSITGVASFDQKFHITEKGKALLSKEVSEVSFWTDFVSHYQENEEKPFIEISNAFLKIEEPLQINEIYYGIVRNYRKREDDTLEFNVFDSLEIPSVASRRLALMLQLLERTGALLKIGRGKDQRWKPWNTAVLKKIAQTEEFTTGKNSTKKNVSHKPFLLLAGISGTGKTRFIREQAANQKGQDNYCLVPVRPDWHEPSDLLGYVSRLSGKKEYVTTPVIDFIVKSWVHIFEQTGEVRGDGKIGLTQAHLEQIPPFWLCLDEMNLAPVEQYFADYLSIIETRHWLTATDVAAYNEATDSEYDHIYECAPLLKANVLNQQLDDAARQLLATQWQLDLNNSLHAKIWEHFCRYGIALPFNLMVAGTVNMDETTHGFSRKVIDRALTFDFNEFFPNNFDHYFAPQLQPNILGYPLWSDGRAIVDDPALNEDKQSSVDFLKAVNTVLEKSPFELAYRALNELMLALLAHRPADKAHLIAIWDDFMMCKVLPRIEGDSDKLRSHRADTGASAPDNLLCELEEVLQKHFGACWDGLRPDLFNSRLGDSVAEATPAPAPHLVPCRSKKKLAWMKERLEKQCFTSYWP